MSPRKRICIVYTSQHKTIRAFRPDIRWERGRERKGERGYKTRRYPPRDIAHDASVKIPPRFADEWYRASIFHPPRFRGRKRSSNPRSSSVSSSQCSRIHFGKEKKGAWSLGGRETERGGGSDLNDATYSRYTWGCLYSGHLDDAMAPFPVWLSIISRSKSGEGGGGR